MRSTDIFLSPLLFLSILHAYTDRLLAVNETADKASCASYYNLRETVKNFHLHLNFIDHLRFLSNFIVSCRSKFFRDLP